MPNMGLRVRLIRACWEAYVFASAIHVGVFSSLTGIHVLHFSARSRDYNYEHDFGTRRNYYGQGGLMVSYRSNNACLAVQCHSSPLAR